MEFWGLQVGGALFLKASFEDQELHWVLVKVLNLGYHFYGDLYSKHYGFFFVVT